MRKWSPIQKLIAIPATGIPITVICTTVTAKMKVTQDMKIPKCLKMEEIVMDECLTGLSLLFPDLSWASVGIG
ncbi:UNVERIFIED_CONTAM: hypothetical protein FKN15_046408 [Acipenser sinensis]